jgi:hypothetical protein
VFSNLNERRFFDSLNFKHWFEKKKLEAEKKLELIQLELLADYVIIFIIK